MKRQCYHLYFVVRVQEIASEKPIVFNNQGTEKVVRSFVPERNACFEYVRRKV